MRAEDWLAEHFEKEHVYDRRRSITRKEAIELGRIEIEVKILLEYLFELSSKRKTFCKWCNDEDIIADSCPGASSMTCKHSTKRGESGNCKTYRFEDVALLTVFATHNLMSLTLVVAAVQSGSGTLHVFKVPPVVAYDDDYFSYVQQKFSTLV